MKHYAIIIYEMQNCENWSDDVKERFINLYDHDIFKDEYQELARKNDYICHYEKCDSNDVVARYIELLKKYEGYTFRIEKCNKLFIGGVMDDNSIDYLEYALREAVGKTYKFVATYNSAIEFKVDAENEKQAYEMVKETINRMSIMDLERAISKNANLSNIRMVEGE